MQDGRRRMPPEDIDVLRGRYQIDLAQLPARAVDLVGPVAPTVEISGTWVA